MGDVLEVCDADAVAAMFEKVVRVADPPSSDLYLMGLKIADFQDGECGGDRGRLYVHLTWRGFGPARGSPEEATEAVQEGACLYGCGHNLGYGGQLLGYEAPYGAFAVEAPVDEVVLLWDSVALRGGEMLGLVQNMSAELFAREVTVRWGGRESVFALTLQPGEVAPFVLDAAGSSVLPEPSEVEVSAALSPQPDLSRSFFADFPFGALHSSYWDVGWVQQQMADPDFGANWAPLDPSLGPGDEVNMREWNISVELVAPESHPDVVAGLEDLVVEEMRAYLTFLDGHGRVFAVHRLVPENGWADPDEPLRGLPVRDEDGNLQYNGMGELIYDFGLEFYWAADSEYDPIEVEAVLHIGGAGPWTRADAAGP